MKQAGARNTRTTRRAATIGVKPMRSRPAWATATGIAGSCSTAATWTPRSSRSFASTPMWPARTSSTRGRTNITWTSPTTARRERSCDHQRLHARRLQARLRTVQAGIRHRRGQGHEGERRRSRQPAGSPEGTGFGETPYHRPRRLLLGDRVHEARRHRMAARQREGIPFRQARESRIVPRGPHHHHHGEMDRQGQHDHGRGSDRRLPARGCDRELRTPRLRDRRQGCGNRRHHVEGAWLQDVQRRQHQPIGRIEACHPARRQGPLLRGKASASPNEDKDQASTAATTR